MPQNQFMKQALFTVWFVFRGTDTLVCAVLLHVKFESTGIPRLRSGQGSACATIA